VRAAGRVVYRQRTRAQHATAAEKGAQVGSYRDGRRGAHRRSTSSRIDCNGELGARRCSRPNIAQNYLQNRGQTKYVIVCTYHSFNCRDGLHSPNPTMHSQVPAGFLMLRVQGGVSERGRSDRAVENIFRTQNQQNIRDVRNGFPSNSGKAAGSCNMMEATLSSSTWKTSRIRQIYYIRCHISRRIEGISCLEQ